MAADRPQRQTWQLGHCDGAQVQPGALPGLSPISASRMRRPEMSDCAFWLFEMEARS